MTFGVIGTGLATAVGGAVGSQVIGGLFGGGGGGGSAPQQAGAATSQSGGIPFNLLAALAGGSSLVDLFGTGPQSLRGIQTQAAATADPFSQSRQLLSSQMPG